MRVSHLMRISLSSEPTQTIKFRKHLLPFETVSERVRLLRYKMPS